MAEKILVVEDEPTLQETLAYNLKRQGYAVELAGDGQAGIEAARRAQPNLIVLDIMLPILDGFDLRIEPGERVVARKLVRPDEWDLAGHFPGRPVVPGVLIVEAMAQTSAVLVSLTLDLVDRNPLVYFMNIDGCKFRRKVVPGDVLELHVTVKRGGGKIWKFHGRALVEGELAAEAEFTAMIDLRG